MKTKIVTIGLVFLTSTLFAGPKDDKKKEVPGASATPTEGVIYSLPETGIRVYIKATRERFVNGPFYLYAPKMLGIENAPSASSDRWNMDEMRIEAFSEPDPDQVHKALGQAAQLVSLTESGILAGINTTIQVKESGILTQQFLTKNLDNQVKFTDLSIWSYFPQSDSTKSFKMVSGNIEQKAAEAAETIFNLRNSRFNLLTNANDEPLPDGKSFEVMAEELGKMEENYLSLFIGKSSKQTYNFSFEYIPGSKTMKGEVFFRFSEDRGVLPKSDLSGRPIVIEVNKFEDLATKQSALSSSENPEAGKSGIFYRMPGMAEIRILDGSTQLVGARTPIAQFGTTAPIPENLLDGNYKLEFYPNTGAIKSILETAKPVETQK
jgi:hypothetical protein